MELVASKPPVTLNIVGVEDLASPRRVAAETLGERVGFRIYGNRVNDTARRLVVIEVPMKDAAEYMREAGQLGDFPQIEVDDKHWAYVAVVGAGEAQFKKENPPNGPAS